MHKLAKKDDIYFNKVMALKNAGGMSNMSDHDLLIRLDTRFDELTNQIKLNNDGIISKITDHEGRLRSMETVRDDFDPEKMKEIILANNQWIHDFRLTWKTILGIGVAVGSAVGATVSSIINIQNVFKN